MTNIRDVVLSQDARLRTKEDKPPRYRAEIVVQRDSRTGTESVFAFGRPWRVWVRLWSASGNVLPAYNVRGVPAIEGMPVYVTRLYGTESELEIVGVDMEMLEATDSYDKIPFVVQHALSHEWPDFEPGFDALTVYPRAISILKTYADIDHPSLWVLVSPLRYWHGGAVVEFDGGSVDLTASVPAGANQARLVLVYLDAATNALGTTNGTIGMSAEGWSLSRPTITTGVWPSAFVRLENGQTDINEDDILDARMFLNAAGYPHNILSTPHHPDSLTAAVQRGDLMVGGFTLGLPAWERMAIGATDGFRLVRDVAAGAPGAMMRWGHDFLWPWNSQFLLINAGAANTEYATLALAAAAANAGDTILVPPGTHTVNNVTIPAGVNVVGMDRDQTILQTTTVQYVLTLGGAGCYFHNLTLKNAQASAAFISCMTCGTYGAALQDCLIITANTGAGAGAAAYGVSVANPGVCRLVDTDVTTSITSGTSYSYPLMGTGEFNIESGRLDAGTTGTASDVFAGAVGSVIKLDNPILINNTIDGPGTVLGYYFDQQREMLIDLAALGDTFFNDADGLLLLDFQRWEQRGVTSARANYIIGSRLERARVGLNHDNVANRGALHFEAGRWQNKRALVIEEYTDNHATNPSFETDAAGWINYASGAAAGTRARSTAQARFGQYSYLLTKTGGAAGDRWGAYDLLANSVLDRDYVASAWAWLGPGCTAYVVISKGPGVGAAQDEIESVTSPVGQWVRLVTPVLTANATGDGMAVYVWVTGAPTVYAYFDGVQVEHADHATTYIDGDQGDGYSWAGVPHASISGRQPSYVLLDDYVGLITNSNTLSFRCVVQAPYDADATWPANTNILFDTRGANNNNRILFRYMATTDTFDAYINGADRLISPAQTFKAGDWLDILLTLDFTNDVYKMYINGEEVDADTTAMVAMVGLVVWIVGDDFQKTGAYVGGWTFAEYAVFDRVVTAVEAAQLYSLQRPLIDCGALENRPTVPGVSAGVWLICDFFQSSSVVCTEVYNDTAGDARITFAGAWVCGLVQYECSLRHDDVAGNAYSQLQYYDGAAWRAVPDSEVTVGGVTPDRVRSAPLAVPRQEYEYRAVIYAADALGNARAAFPKIIVSPGGEDNL